MDTGRPAAPQPPGTAIPGLPHLDATVVAASRYLEALTKLSEAEMRAPSLLPGWTRGHVITHLARNADGLAGMLEEARHGASTAMYPSQESRDADIDAGAGRPAAELEADAVETCERWLRAARALPADMLETPVTRLPGTEPFPVRRVGVMRRTEVEVHHADLGTGYTADDWPEDLVDHLLHRRDRELTSMGLGLTVLATDRSSGFSTGGGPEVAGTAADLAWWLIGRGDGTTLTCSAGTLPELGRWV
ncbi:MAG: maleylpyruvate isomerase family mycothiol-dependent enzyme [Nocardioidaceae bacterium]